MNDEINLLDDLFQHDTTQILCIKVENITFNKKDETSFQALKQIVFN